MSLGLLRLRQHPDSRLIQKWNGEFLDFGSSGLRIIIIYAGYWGMKNSLLKVVMDPDGIGVVRLQAATHFLIFAKHPC